MTAQAGDTASPSFDRALLRAKAQQRSTSRAIRAAIPSAERRRAATRAAGALARAVRRAQARHVAVYLGFAEELDPGPLIAALHAQGCSIYVPVVGPQRRLRFALLAPPFTRNRYGIVEPRVQRRPPRLDIVVLPLVAFDAAGGRLGMGGGYYDRWLARHPRVKRVGYAYAAQQVGKVPMDARDMRVHAVATEKGLLKCTG
jgi:5-formyltetrahydrofolate cyclo-ligase